MNLWWDMVNPLPWSWFNDPWWLMLANLAFWPGVFLRAWAMDRWDIRQRRKKVAAAR